MNSVPSEFEFGLAFLRKQKNCSSLPESQLSQMVEAAIEIGAREYGGYIGKSVIECAKMYGVSLQMVTGGNYGRRLMFAQYDHSEKTIRIYEESIRTIIDADIAPVIGVENSVAAVREVLLWHEFFHVLEFNVIGLVGKDFKVPSKFLWFTRKRSLYSISEISASAFAMRILSLRHSPFLFNYYQNWASPEKLTSDEDNHIVGEKCDH